MACVKIAYMGYYTTSKSISRSNLFFRTINIKMLLASHYNTTSNKFLDLQPHLDFDEKFDNLDCLADNMRHRNLTIENSKVYMQGLKNRWEKYKHYKRIKNLLQKKKNHLFSEISTLSQMEETDDIMMREIKRKRIQRLTIKQDLQAVSKIVDQLERTVVLECLQLPNEIDEITPIDVDRVMFENNIICESGNENARHHLDVASDLQLVTYINPIMYYLLNEAALFEQALVTYVSEQLQNHQYTLFSNTDFISTSVAEACCISQDNIILDNQKHLPGTASISTFCSLRAKRSTSYKFIPEHHFTTGREYVTNTNNNNNENQPHLDGLYSVIQQSVVQVFVTTCTYTQEQQELTKLLDLMKGIYLQIGMTFRIVQINSTCLKRWEKSRVSFQVYSHYRKDYVEIGHVSVSGDYISKRLLMYSHKDSGNYSFIRVISAKIISVQSILAAILEGNNYRKFKPITCTLPYV